MLSVEPFFTFVSSVLSLTRQERPGIGVEVGFEQVVGATDFVEPDGEDAHRNENHHEE